MADYLARARAVIDTEIEGLQVVRDHLQQGFEAAVQAILAVVQRDGKVVVTGLGKSLHIGQKIAATMTSTGTPAVTLHPAEALHGDMGILQSGDVVLALSYTGASDELLSLLPLIKREAGAIIAMTGDPASPLAQNSDIVLTVTVPREACPLNISPTASTTAMLAMGDALAMVLLEARGFTREDYAKLHPGGAIGRALLLRIKDIMRTGDRVARIAQDATVQDALYAMTAARAGSVVIVAEDGTVRGIFTDGDLRRHLTDGMNPATAKTAAVMTAQPVVLRETQLALDVLAHFREHQVDDLIVVDEAGHLVGMIDIQDLPKFKLL